MLVCAQIRQQQERVHAQELASRGFYVLKDGPLRPQVTDAAVCARMLTHADVRCYICRLSIARAARGAWCTSR